MTPPGIWTLPRLTVLWRGAAGGVAAGGRGASVGEEDTAGRPALELAPGRGLRGAREEAEPDGRAARELGAEDTAPGRAASEELAVVRVDGSGARSLAAGFWTRGRPADADALGTTETGGAAAAGAVAPAPFPVGVRSDAGISTMTTPMPPLGVPFVPG